MWLRIKIAVLVLVRGEDALLKPYRDEVTRLKYLVEEVAADKELVEKERDFAVEALQVLSKEAMSHIKRLEQEIVRRKEKEAYSLLSSFGGGKDDLPN